MVRGFDADRQQWVGPGQEQWIAVLHRRDALRQRQALLGAVTVLCLCGLVFGVWALGWKDEPKPVRHQLFTPREVTPSGDDDPDGGESAPPQADGPPDGYEAVSDPEGFRVAVPADWTRESVGSSFGIDVVNYRNDDGSRRLQVYQVSEQSPRVSLQDYLDEAKPTGFKKLSFDEPTDDGRPAARLEYLADKITGEPDIGVWHVVDHRFQSVDGKLYAITSYGAEADGRDDELEVLTTALAWFCPPGTECPEPGAE